MNDKPVDLVVHETRKKIQDVLNESGLPITVIALILREMSSSVSQQELHHVQKLRLENEKSRAD